MKINSHETMEAGNTNRYRKIGFSILFGVLGIVFTVIAVVQIMSVWWLQRNGNIVEARVTGWEASKHYLIQYTFVVDGAKASSPNKGKGGWVMIPEDVWHITKTTGTIDVRYNPDYIFFNIPACRSVMPADVFTDLVLGILFLALSTYKGYTAYRNN